MRVSEETFCNRCGRKVGWQWEYGKGDALARAWKIWFPSQTAGGGAGTQLEDYCWECYGNVCDRLDRIYKTEKAKEVDFEVKLDVKVKKQK